MPNDILVRNPPPELNEWINSECREGNLTKQEFIMNALLEAKKNQVTDTPAMFDSGLPADQRNKFRFIDLFAGIGGFRIALERLGGECVFTSEWDKYAQKTYKAWFGDMPQGDINKIEPSEIPDHDILVGGFPCQPFSIAGVSKKISLGRAHGFKDKKQGNLFFVLADIIKEKKPPIVFLENVKNLKSHDKGRTWEVIRSTLDALGYDVHEKIIDAAGWVPQHRERIFIICFNKKVFGKNVDFEYPESEMTPRLKSILEKNPLDKYTLTPNLWDYLQRYAKKHQEKGNGFGFGMANPNGITRTLSARYYKDGSEILLDQGESKPPRRLTTLECKRLMGFPEECKVVVSDTQAYKQFGNAVVVAVAEAVANKVVGVLMSKVGARTQKHYKALA